MSGLTDWHREMAEKIAQAHPLEPERVIKVGSRVRCGVYVAGRWSPMHVGIVTRDHGDGTYDVDRMSLHGGRPWIERERFVRLEPAELDLAQVAREAGL